MSATNSLHHNLLASSLSFLLFLLGTLGNILVILVIFKTPALRRHPTNWHLASVAVADFLLLVSAALPSSLEYLSSPGVWVMGDNVSCSSFVFLQYLSVNVASLSILAFSIERYVAICHPLRARLMCTVKRAKKIIFCIWAFGILYCMPWFFFSGPKPRWSYVFASLDSSPIQEHNLTSPSPIQEHNFTSPSPIQKHNFTSPSYIQEHNFTSPFTISHIIQNRIPEIKNSKKSSENEKYGACIPFNSTHCSIKVSSNTYECGFLLRRELYLTHYMVDLFLFYVTPLVCTSILYALIARTLSQHNTSLSNTTISAGFKQFDKKSTLRLNSVKTPFNSSGNDDFRRKRAVVLNKGKKVADKILFKNESFLFPNSSNSAQEAGVVRSIAKFNGEERSGVEEQSNERKTRMGVAKKWKSLQKNSVDDEEKYTSDDMKRRGACNKLHENNANNVMSSSMNRMKRDEQIERDMIGEDVKSNEKMINRHRSLLQTFNGEKKKKKLGKKRNEMLKRKNEKHSNKTQAVKMLAVVVLVFALLWLPYRAFVVYNSFASKPLQSHNFLLFSRLLVYLNSTINPLLYSLFSLKFRSAFHRLFCCRTHDLLVRSAVRS